LFFGLEANMPYIKTLFVSAQSVTSVPEDEAVVPIRTKLPHVLVIEADVRHELHQFMTQFVRQIDMRGVRMIYHVSMLFDETRLLIESIQSCMKEDLNDGLHLLAKSWEGNKVIILDKKSEPYTSDQLDKGSWSRTVITCRGPLPLSGRLEFFEESQETDWPKETGPVILL
jgi:hypothetical protein